LLFSNPKRGKGGNSRYSFPEGWAQQSSYTRFSFKLTVQLSSQSQTDPFSGMKIPENRRIYQIISEYTAVCDEFPITKVIGHTKEKAIDDNLIICRPKSTNDLD
jgi:hypothetical protein